METYTECLGTFSIDSGKVYISDPCYKPGTWCQASDVEVKPGTWRAFVEKAKIEDWGTRCVSLYAVHESEVDNMDELISTLLDTTLGVDSGQLGIFDSSMDVGSGDYGESDTFYGACCDITILTGKEAGIVHGKGVVSSSGFGDGSYRATLGVNDAGVVVAIDVEFIVDE